MAEYVLVIYNDNWADEFDVAGFSVMEKKDWTRMFEGNCRVIQRTLDKQRAALLAKFEAEYGALKDQCTPEMVAEYDLVKGDPTGRTLLYNDKYRKQPNRLWELVMFGGYDKYMEYVKSSRLQPNGYETYFGTNESMIYRNVDQYKQSFKVVELTEEEYQLLKKLFGNDYSEHFGFGFDRCFDYFYDEEEELPDEDE